MKNMKELVCEASEEACIKNITLMPEPKPSTPGSDLKENGNQSPTLRNFASSGNIKDFDP
jgi:hypothetical protein